MRSSTLTKILAVGAASALALTACSSERSTDSAESTTEAESSTETTEGSEVCFGEGATIGVALPQKTSENWVLAEELFNDGLAEAGYEPLVQFANGGVTEQQNQIDSMVQQGAEVIIVGAIDGSQLGGQLQSAKDSGATVIAYDRLVKNTDAVDAYIAFDNYQVGVLQGEALLQGLAERQGEGPYNIELIAGSADDANSIPFFEGAMSVLQPKIDDGTLTVVSGQTTFEQAATQGWKAENAQKRWTRSSPAPTRGTPRCTVYSPPTTRWPVPR